MTRQHMGKRLNDSTGGSSGVVPVSEKKNLYLGIATADTVSSAKKCMKQLGVLEYLDYIGGDDGKKRPKPYPDMLYDFAEKSGILPQQVMVAGDTRNDMVFAEQAKRRQ